MLLGHSAGARPARTAIWTFLSWGDETGSQDPDGKEGSLLKHLDEICIKADLIEVTRKLRIPEFSGDGRYLAHYSVHEFTKALGTPEDDVTNTFTARLLLLLESRPSDRQYIRKT